MYVHMYNNGKVCIGPTVILYKVENLHQNTKPEIMRYR